MPFIIFFILISLPVLEVASIVEMSRWVGPLVTFLLLAASVAFGAFLIRSQSLAVGRRVVEAMQAGTPPERPLLDSGMVALAGILFMIPGFITDIVAILILIPAARRRIWKATAFSLRGTSWRKRQGAEAEPKRAQQPGDVIDVEFTEVPKDQASEGSRAQRDDSPWRKPL
jgi:UPF0716 protein FxsA